MSFFKVKDDEPKERVKSIRPRLRPAPTASALKERQGGGSSGKGGEATPKYDVNAKGWSDQVAKFNKKGGINNDGRFGYGYVDTQTGIEVPWYIDMINGGGANAAGDTFVSPFENSPMGKTPLGAISRGVSGGLNKMGVAPYGYNKPRYFMPMEAARVDAEGKPVQADLGPASSGANQGSSGLLNTPPVNPYGVGGGFENTAPPAMTANTAAMENANIPNNMRLSMNPQSVFMQQYEMYKQQGGTLPPEAFAKLFGMA